MKELVKWREGRSWRDRGGKEVVEMEGGKELEMEGG